MKLGQVIQREAIKQGISTLKLDHIYPIGSISGNHLTDIVYFVDEFVSSKNTDQVVYANKIVITASQDTEVEILLGNGYLSSKDEEWTKKFSQKQGWSGSDGIYSFNLTTGNDQFDQKRQFTNLFVFGDTFVGRTDKITKRRYEPLLMPNNSMGYLDANSDKIEFLVNKTDKDSVTAFFKIEPAHDIVGTIAQNLVTYDQKKTNDGWISGYNPKKVWLIFDLNTPEYVDQIDIYNYYSQESSSLASRGVRIFRLLASSDNKKWNDLGEYELKKSTSKNDYQSITVGGAYRYFQFDIHFGAGIGNHEDEMNEGVFALSRVDFLHDGIKYRDIQAEASSTMLIDGAKSWIWLQDGVVVDKNLYFFPYQVVSDMNQPEGLQFGIKGISMIKVPVIDNRIDFKNAIQKRTPFLFQKGESEITFGGGLMPNTRQAGSLNPDGFVYVYGYQTTYGLRQLVAARVLENDFELFDKWEFFDGIRWQKDITKTAPFLDHISTEFSVSPILKGRNKGKYICVFTYDTNTPYVAFSLSKSPVGPFDNPQIIYKTPEQEIFKSTTYTYNAKAHPQLCESDNILVSYNTNTYNFEHNMSNCDIYGPRIIRLREI